MLDSLTDIAGFVSGIALGMNIIIWPINAHLFYKNWKRTKQEINGVVTWVSKNKKYEYTRRRLNHA